MSKKRGQITIFMILGVILLLSFLLFYFLRREVSVFKPETVVPPEIIPVNNFILGCVDSVSREAGNLVGANGGYVELPPGIANDRLAAVPDFTFSPVRTALWFYRGQNRIPPLDYIQFQLENYIHDNLIECLQGFEPFRQTFNITELGNLSLNVDLADEGFIVDVKYPLDIILRAREQKFFLDDFSVTVPFRIKKMHELAEKIIREELATRFIETRTIDLIALDPAIPYTGSEFRCMPFRWEIKDIESKLRRLLNINLPRIVVDSTEYEPIPKENEYERNHYVWPVTEEKYPGTHVSFSYDESWPLELYIRPNKGKYLRSNPNRGQEMLSFLCMQIWHFTYDVRYPVLVTLKDDATRIHEDYTFNFGFDVSINHNMPDKSNFASSTFSFDTAPKEDDYCSNAKSNILTVHTFENVSTKEAGDLITEIDDVDISFTCVNMRCPVGESEWQFRGAVSYVSKEVPYCVNGVLRGEKEGYEEAEMFVTTDKEKSVDLYLRPTIEIPISVVKHYEMSPSVQEEFEEGDSAYLTLKADNFESEAAFSHNSTGTLKLLSKWNYEYNLTIYLMDESTIRGGYQVVWTAEWDKLRSAKEIVFHVLERPYSEDPEKLAEMVTKMDQLSLQYSIPDPEIITVIRPR